MIGSRSLEMAFRGKKSSGLTRNAQQGSKEPEFVRAPNREELWALDSKDPPLGPCCELASNAYVPECAECLLFLGHLLTVEL